MPFHSNSISLRLGIIVIACQMMVAVTPSSANAQDRVWFEAIPATAGSLVLDEGPGVALALACDTDLQPEDPVFVWDTTMRFQNEMPLYGWSMNFKTVSDSVSAVQFDYGERVFSPDGFFQGYVPLPSVFDFAELGHGRDLATYVGMHSLTPCQTYEASTDGVAWSVFKFRIVKVITDRDAAQIDIYGETGPFGWADEIGWGSAIIGDNDLMEVWDPGTRYPNPLITIECPQGPLWSPGLEGPLYPPEEEPPPVDPPTDDPPVVDPPVDEPPVDEPPVNNPPPDESPTTPPTSNPQNPNNNNNNDNSPPPVVDDDFELPPFFEPGVFSPPIAPTAPLEENEDNRNSTPVRPVPPKEPLPGSDSLIAMCGAQSGSMLLIAMAGIIGLKSRRRRSR